MKNYLVVNFKNGQKIVFDEYADDREEDIEYQTFSVRICEDHLNKCRNLLEEVGCTIDDNGSGCCSVKGCSATWEDEDTEVFYVYIPINATIETDECETIESVDEVPT